MPLPGLDLERSWCPSAKAEYRLGHVRQDGYSRARHSSKIILSALVLASEDVGKRRVWFRWRIPVGRSDSCESMPAARSR